MTNKEYRKKQRERYDYNIAGKEFIKNIPICSEHKVPMKLLQDGIVMKSYHCNEEECKEYVDIIKIIMKGQNEYNKKQRETEAKIKNRNIKNLYKEKMF